MERVRWPSRNHQRALQNALGDVGEVMPYLQVATPALPARGWYARLASGKLVFLADSSGMAHVRIARLIEEARSAANEAEQASTP